VRFIQRFVANAMAVFLALYLVDSVAGECFVLKGVWAAVILAFLLGLLNSIIRPLWRARTKPVSASAVAIATVLVNALILQALVWAKALSSGGFAWVLLTAAFVTVITGTISWLIGFGGTEKPRATASSEDKTPSERAIRDRSRRTRAPGP
jgi:putative membrane protein